MAHNINHANHKLIFYQILEFNMNNYLKLTLTCCCLLILTGCPRQFNITHNAFANTRYIPHGFPIGCSFTVEPMNGVNDPMMNQEIKCKIEHILQNKGYIILQDRGQSQFYIVFDYRMESSKKTVDVTQYIPGETVTSHSRKLKPGHTTEYEDQTTYTQGKFVKIPKVCDFYGKSLFIQVYDTRNAHLTPVWQGSAECNDRYEDLRDSLDYLLITSLRHFGYNTQKTIETSIYSDNEDVIKLRENIFHMHP